MSMFLLDCRHQLILKSARIIMLAESEDDAREKFAKTFIYQMGMRIETAQNMGTFYMLD